MKCHENAHFGDFLVRYDTATSLFLMHAQCTHTCILQRTCTCCLCTHSMCFYTVNVSNEVEEGRNTVPVQVSCLFFFFSFRLMEVTQSELFT